MSSARHCQKRALLRPRTPTCPPAMRLVLHGLGAVLTLALAEFGTRRVAAAEPLNVYGRWSDLQDWGEGATHMALLRRGSDSSIVVYWNHGEHARYWQFIPLSDSNLTDHVPARTAADTGDVFCSGHTVLSDGRLAVFGGTWEGETGIDRVVTFDPNELEWADQDSMHWDRWYPTATLLPSGKVLITSGLHFFSMATFGGRTVSSYANAVDQLALTQHAFWADRPVSGDPGDREDHTAVFSPNSAKPLYNHQGYVMLFGGRRDATILNDVWFATREDTDFGEKWVWEKPSPMDTTVLPPPRYQHGAACWRPSQTSSEDQLIVYGGLDVNGDPLDDLWRLRKVGGVNGTWTWEELSATSNPGGGPGARYGHVMVLDPGNTNLSQTGPPRVLLHGGKVNAQGALADSQAWILWLDSDPPRWRKPNESETGTPPRRRAHHAATFESDRPGHLATRRMLLFGGEGLSNSVSTLFDDAWSFGRGDTVASDTTYRWIRLDTLTTLKPSARYRHAVIHNRDLGWLIVSGGDSTLNSPTTGLTPTTWFMRLNVSGAAGQQWLPLPMDSIPANSGRAGHAAVSYHKRVNVRQPELFDPSMPPGQQMTSLDEEDALKLDFFLYPHMNVLPSGNLFWSGQTKPTHVLDPDPQSGSYGWGSAINSNFYGGSSIMYEPGRVMKCGGDNAADSSALIVFDSDDSHGGWSSAWRTKRIANRTNHNLTMLPDGRVLATGGRLNGNDASLPRPRPQVWDPTIPNWGDTLAEEPSSRGYHSTALLLPDARIISSGGNAHNGPTTDQPSTFSIFEPPYLFDDEGELISERPEINARADTIGWGQRFTVATDEADDIGLVTLIKSGATTHAFNQDQRFVKLDFTIQSNPKRLLVDAPTNGNLAPPGNWLLFLVQAADSLPSIAKWVRLGAAPGQDDADSIRSARVGSYSAADNPCGDPATVTLSWTAPADDSLLAASGKAKSYEVRFSTTGPSGTPADTTEWFEETAEAVNETPPAPNVVGTSQSLVMARPDPGSWYWYGIRAIDDKPHKGAIRVTKININYIDCGGGFAGGGGGGGGGGSSLRRDPGAFSLVGGGPGVQPEHSLFEGADPLETSEDLIAFGTGSDAQSYVSWIRVTDGQRVNLDAVELLTVDHDPEASAFAAGDGIVAGVVTAASELRSGSGQDLAAEVTGDGLLLRAGDVLVAEFETAGSATDHLVVEGSRAAPRGATESSGLVIEVPHGESWSALARVHPRATTSHVTTALGERTRIRLRAESPIVIRSVGRLASSESEVVVVTRPVVSASTGLDDVTATLLAADSTSTTIQGPDTLQLAFEPTAMADGATRSYFLRARGQWGSELSAMATTLRQVTVVPARFALRPNRPNPLRDRTDIEFDLPMESRVVLRIFDAQGRQVRTVASGSWAAGTHVVGWDRRDTRGNRVAPGVYLYRLEAGSSRAERKLVVLP